MKKLSVEKIEQIKLLRAAGCTYTQIALEVGCSRASVLNVLGRQRGWSRVTAEQRAQALALLAAGQSKRAVCAAVGISRPTLDSIIRIR